MNKKQEKKKEDKVIQIHEDTNKLKQLRKEVINKYNKLNNEDKIKSSKDIGVTSTMTKTKRVLNARTTIEKDLIEVNDLLDDLVKKVDAEKKKDEIKRTEINEKNDIDDQLEEVKKKQANQPKWLNSLNRSKTSNSVKHDSLYNAVLILNNDPDLKGLFKYNEFTTKAEVVEERTIKPRHAGELPLVFKKGTLSEDHIRNVIQFIERSPYYSRAIFKKDLIQSAIISSAKSHTYNPLIDYFERVYRQYKDKPTHLLENILTRTLGAEDNWLNHEIIKNWAVEAVAKAYNPNSKCDQCLDLVGGQGIGKTTFLRKIAPLGYYTDAMTDFENKDNFSIMQKALIVNDDELAASQKSGFANVKKFFTLQKLEYREAYARLFTEGYKRFVIARTTNIEDYLKDVTGDRRFMTVQCGVVKPKDPIHPADKEFNQKIIDEFWGEAVKIYKEDLLKDHKYSLELTQKVQDALDQVKKDHTSTSDFDDTLQEVLENRTCIITNKKGQDCITNHDLWYQLEIHNYNKEKYGKELKRLMRNKYHWIGNKTIRKDGKVEKGYIKEN